MKIIRLERPGSEENSFRRIEVDVCGRPVMMRLDLNKPTQRYIHDILDAGLIYEDESTLAIANELNPGETFFDVGACCGWFSAVAAVSGARVIAFEPIAANCAALIANVPSVVVVKAVVSDVAGETSLYLNLDNDGGHALWPCGQHPHNILTLKAGEPRMTIQSVCLDEYAGHAPTVIKIDTEGAEWQALNGARQILSQPQLRMVVAECNITGLPLMGHQPDEIETLMREYGFRWEPIEKGSITKNWIFRR